MRLGVGEIAVSIGAVLSNTGPPSVADTRFHRHNAVLVVAHRPVSVSLLPHARPPFVPEDRSWK